MSNDKNRRGRRGRHQKSWPKKLPEKRFKELQERVSRGVQLMLRSRSSGWITQVLSSAFTVNGIECNALEKMSPSYSEFRWALMFLKEDKQFVWNQTNLVSYGFDIEDRFADDISQYWALDRIWTERAGNLGGNGYPRIQTKIVNYTHGRLNKPVKACNVPLTEERKHELRKRVRRGALLLRRQFPHEWEDRVLHRNFQYELMGLCTGKGLYPFVEVYWAMHGEEPEFGEIRNEVSYGFDSETTGLERQKDFTVMDYFWTEEAERSKKSFV